MKKVWVKRILYMTVLMLFIGIIIIIFSTKIGSKIGYNAIQENGGSMDTSKYKTIVETSTFNFHNAGIALSVVGGLGSLLGGYTLYKEL